MLTSIYLSSTCCLPHFSLKQLPGYIELMVKSAVMLGGNEKKARQELKRAFEFETLLAKLSIPREERRNYTTMYNKMKIKEIQQMARNVSVLQAASLRPIASAKATFD